MAILMLSLLAKFTINLMKIEIVLNFKSGAIFYWKIPISNDSKVTGYWTLLPSETVKFGFKVRNLTRNWVEERKRISVRRFLSFLALPNLKCR